MRFVNSLESSARSIRMKREKKRHRSCSTKKKKNFAQVKSVHSAPPIVSSQEKKRSDTIPEKPKDELQPGMMLIVPDMEDEMSAVTISPVNAENLSKNNPKNVEDENKNILNHQGSSHSTTIKTPFRDVSNNGYHSSRRKKKTCSVHKSRKKKSRCKQERFSDDDDSISNEKTSSSRSMRSARKSRRDIKLSARILRKQNRSPSFPEDSDADDELCSTLDLPVRSLFIGDEKSPPEANDERPIQERSNEGIQKLYASIQNQRYTNSHETLSSYHKQNTPHYISKQHAGNIQHHQNLYQTNSPHSIMMPLRTRRMTCSHLSGNKKI